MVARQHEDHHLIWEFISVFSSRLLFVTFDLT